MDIATTTPPPAYSSAAKTAENTPTKPTLSSDFETFLRMLTVQMQNQDPMNPVDSSDYAVQLATFSSVEQQVLTNDLLRDMSSVLGAGGLGQLASWVGMEALSSAPARFSGSPVTIRPEIPTGATKAELVVRDASGTVADRQDITGHSGSMQWAGTTAAGAPMASGNYSFEMEVTTESGDSRTIPVPTYGRIVEARAVGGEIMLELEGGTEIPSTAVSALRSD